MGKRHTELDLIQFSLHPGKEFVCILPVSSKLNEVTLGVRG